MLSMLSSIEWPLFVMGKGAIYNTIYVWNVEGFTRVCDLQNIIECIDFTPNYDGIPLN